MARTKTIAVDVFGNSRLQFTLILLTKEVYLGVPVGTMPPTFPFQKYIQMNFSL